MLDQVSLTNASPPLRSPALDAEPLWSTSPPVVVPEDAQLKRVLRQFVEALLFEKLITYTASARSSEEPFAAIYDLRVDFEVGDLRYRCVATITSFSRVRILEGSIHRVVAGM